MSDPVISFWKVTSGGTTYSNVLKRFNEAGAPQATQLIDSTSAGSIADDFGNVRAGQWSVPMPMIFAFDASGNVVNLSFFLYDAVSNLEDFFPGGSANYDFRIKLAKDYTDPTTISSGTIATWPTMPHGSGATPYSFDTNYANPGNDGTSNMIIAHNSTSNRWMFNGYVYVAFKPQAAAASGLQTGWSFEADFDAF